jgi:sec-independent protein translocase protein TatB
MDIFSAKFLFLALIALVVLGPDKLPGALRTGGRLLGELRRISAQLSEQSGSLADQAGLSQPLEELRQIRTHLRAPLAGLGDLHSSVRDELGGAGQAGSSTPVDWWAQSRAPIGQPEMAEAAPGDLAPGPLLAQHLFAPGPSAEGAAIGAGRAQDELELQWP